MPKHGFLTPKAIANRIKSKGLQKLRWYCQVCQKQCRDENGFKCHTNSESHQRQMLIVAHNPDKFMTGYSEMFEKGFLDILSRRHGTKRMRANFVYNEYIADKEHVHMNATKWTTLSGFVQYLGREGKCLVDETEKGWYISYIDRDPRKAQREKEYELNRQAELDHEERTRKFIARQVKLAAQHKKSEDVDEEVVKFKRASDQKIAFNLDSNSANATASTTNQSNVFHSSSQSQPEKTAKRKPTSALDALMQEELQKKQKVSKQKVPIVASSGKNWIAKDIVVKVMTKSLAEGKYYKKKGVVEVLEDKYSGILEMLESGDRILLDQEDLETVIPQPQHRVKILRGKYRHELGILKSLNLQKYTAIIELDEPSYRRKELELDYEDFSKYHKP